MVLYEFKLALVQQIHHLLYSCTRPRRVSRGWPSANQGKRQKNPRRPDTPPGSPDQSCGASAGNEINIGNLDAQFALIPVGDNDSRRDEGLVHRDGQRKFVVLPQHISPDAITLFEDFSLGDEFIERHVVNLNGDLLAG